MAGGGTFCPHLSRSGMKSGAGIPSSLCSRVALFLATAIPEGPAPNPRDIGCGTTQTEALAIVAAYCPATHRVGTPTHAIAPAKVGLV